VGYHAAKFLSEEDGCRIIGVIERDGALLDEDGLNVEEVRNWIAQHGGVTGYPNARRIEEGAKLLEHPCDILIPAAYENQITVQNAANVKATIIAEAANGPTTPEADDILYDRGVLLIPDILANAGGVNPIGCMEAVLDLARKKGLKGLKVGVVLGDDILEQIPDLVDVFDFAVNEQCHEFDECEVYAAFVDRDKPVFNAEYAQRFVDDPESVCARSIALGLRTLLLPLDLDNSFRISCD